MIDEVNWAQSCITSIGFPDTIECVFEMLEENEYKEENLTDIDCILRFNPDDGSSWTAATNRTLSFQPILLSQFLSFHLSIRILGG